MNGLPFGVSPPEVPGGESKYDWFVHAEASAIAKTSLESHRIGRFRLHALWASCPSCATLVAQAGVDEVVTLQRLHDLTPERWKAKVDTGLRILEAAGVTVRFFDEPLGVKLLFDGREVAL